MSSFLFRQGDFTGALQISVSTILALHMSEQAAVNGWSHKVVETDEPEPKRQLA